MYWTQNLVVMGSSRIVEKIEGIASKVGLSTLDMLAIWPRRSGTSESNLVSNSTNCIIVQVLTQTTNH